MSISAPPKGVNNLKSARIEENAYAEEEALPKKALITGATSGIGLAFLKLLVSKGIQVLATGRNQEVLDSLGCKTLNLDLEKDRTALINWIRDEAPDLVVNNAGFGFYGKAIDIPIKDQLAMVEVNNKALLEITLEAVHTWLRKGKRGVVLNVASGAAFQPFPTFAVYAATKAFVVNLSEGLDQELSSRGIRVLASCPGMVKTNFQKRASGNTSERSSRFMTPEYAAERLWEQVLKEKRVDIFDWRYLFLVRFGQFFLPNRWIGAFLKRFIGMTQKHR
ncbi:MAG: SDR family NAD(P)-dependent oxidoreductase [Chlamydiia bacterium]|nr:SDR family NAD(P)-dependent oxidoreductase [Chlamydiia bacterium]